LLVGVAAVSYQHRTNCRLEAELAQFAIDSHAVAAARNENLRLARVAAEDDELRRAQAELPALRHARTPALSISASPAPAQATVTVRPNGTIMWNQEPVTLEGFLARLKSLEQGTPNGDARLSIRGLSMFGPLAWVIDEARKAQIEHVVVESGATLDPKVGSSWFGK